MQPVMAVNYLKCLPNWNNSEIVALEAMQGVSFKEMTENEQSIAIVSSVFNISVISGCELPTDKLHKAALNNEMKKFMKENESFYNLTHDEILAAFRFNAAGKFDEKVKHWQGLFNLEYLGNVLLKWVEYKGKVKRKAEKELLRKNVFDLSTGSNLTDDEAIQFAKDEWTRTNDYMYIEARVYDILKAMGKINTSDESRARITARAKEKAELIYRADFYSLYWMAEKELCSIICKKIAVSEYFDAGSKTL